MKLKCRKLFFLFLCAEILLFAAQTNPAFAKPEIPAKLLYGDWEGGGFVWKFYDTDLSLPEYQMTIGEGRPDKPWSPVPQRPEGERDQQIYRLLTGDHDPIGYKKAERKNEPTVAVSIRQSLDIDPRDAQFYYTVGRYVDNAVKIGARVGDLMFSDNKTIIDDWNGPGPKNDMPNLGEFAEGNENYKRYFGDEVFNLGRVCQPHPTPFPASFTEMQTLPDIMVVRFPPEITYHWIDFKTFVDPKTKEVRLKADVWRMKQTCIYEYKIHRILGDTNISEYEPYLSNSFELTPVEPRYADYAEDFPSYASAEGAHKDDRL
jgi:hypothetical protein